MTTELSHRLQNYHRKHLSAAILSQHQQSIGTHAAIVIQFSGLARQLNYIIVAIVCVVYSITSWTPYRTTRTYEAHNLQTHEDKVVDVT